MWRTLFVHTCGQALPSLRCATVNKHQDDPKDREDEPLEDADAQGCQATNEQCGFSPSERDGSASESEFSLREEIFETFKPVTEVMVESPIDGMPVPSDERFDLAKAHPFTRETVVCVEDDTAFVELFEDELGERGWEGKRGLLGLGAETFAPKADSGRTVVADARPKYAANGKEHERRTFKPEQVVHGFGVSYTKLSGGYVLPVRMKRERCKHWMRQVMANDDQPEPTEFGHLIRFSNCAARRSVGGALMSMRDEAMYACDYREPYDRETAEKYLDKHDRDRLNSKRHLELIRPFNLAD